MRPVRSARRPCSSDASTCCSSVTGQPSHRGGRASLGLAERRAH
ncbi:hypothetical protein ACFPRL_14685 [Pseudoclavibacter helvolus]